MVPLEAWIAIAGSEEAGAEDATGSSVAFLTRAGFAAGDCKDAGEPAGEAAAEGAWEEAGCWASADNRSGTSETTTQRDHGRDQFTGYQSYWVQTLKILISIIIAKGHEWKITIQPFQKQNVAS